MSFCKNESFCENATETIDYMLIGDTKITDLWKKTI